MRMVTASRNNSNWSGLPPEDSAIRDILPELGRYPGYELHVVQRRQRAWDVPGRPWATWMPSASSPGRKTTTGSRAWGISSTTPPREYGTDLTTTAAAIPWERTGESLPTLSWAWASETCTARCAGAALREILTSDAHRHALRRLAQGSQQEEYVAGDGNGRLWLDGQQDEFLPHGRAGPTASGPMKPCLEHSPGSGAAG